MRRIRRILINIYTAFIFDRDRRKLLRSQFKKTYLTPDASKMNLAVSYSVWDCEELLEASIRNIRPATSYINVVWQKYSWDNQECSKTLEPLLHRLKEQGLVDNIIFYEHQGKVKYRAAKERQKRNIGLEDAKKAGCNYFLIVDADEFYDLREFKKAQEIILANKITHSACPIFNYWKTPEYRDLNPDNFSVPFIYRIDRHSKLSKNRHYPCNIDGTREMEMRSNSKFLYINRVNMQHMSFIRKDIEEKYKNASTGDPHLVQNTLTKYNNLNDDNLAQYSVVKVEDKFGLIS